MERTFKEIGKDKWEIKEVETNIMEADRALLERTRNNMKTQRDNMLKAAADILVQMNQLNKLLGHAEEKEK